MLQAIQTANLLLVDDQESNIQLLTSILEAAGYTKLVSTTDARQAVPLFGQITGPHPARFDDALCGRLPGAGADQARTPYSADFLILVLTADITNEAKHRALTLGAKDFLTKPFYPVEVLLRIRNFPHTRFLHLQFQEQNRVLEERVRERTSELEQAQEEILERSALEPSIETTTPASTPAAWGTSLPSWPVRWVCQSNRPSAPQGRSLARCGQNRYSR